MKTLKSVLFLALISLILVSTSQCSTAKTIKMQEKAPIETGQANYQYWVAGVKGGGSGIHLNIPITTNMNNITLDSCYFRGLSAKIQSSDKGLYAGFKTPANQESGPIANSNEDTLTKENKNFPFELQDNECVVSYIENNKTKYFKIEKLVEKERDYYPSQEQKQNID